MDRFAQTPFGGPPLDHKSKNLTMLVAAILVLVVVAIALYAVFGGARSGGGGRGGGPNPCASPIMPTLGGGLRCDPGGAGGFAWLTAAAPAAHGVATPPSLTERDRHVASDASCVTESACQGYCLNDSSCSYYSYDSSKQNSTAKCPAAGSVCTTYGGGVPASIAAGQTPYISGGIPAGLLPAKKAAFGGRAC
jgi:hypothetical protein